MAADFSNVNSPEDLISFLRQAAQEMYESASELASAHQDPQAGKFWDKAAKEFEHAADKLEGEI